MKKDDDRPKDVRSDAAAGLKCACALKSFVGLEYLHHSSDAAHVQMESRLKTLGLGRHDAEVRGANVKVTGLAWLYARGPSDRRERCQPPC